MSSFGLIRKSPAILLMIFVFHAGIRAGDNPPTIVFYAAYIFEATSNGETTEFPLLPGETAVSTIESVIETTQGYIERLASIYSFQHFNLKRTTGGSFSIGLMSGDGGMHHRGILEKGINTFQFSVSARSGPSHQQIPLRIKVFVNPDEMPQSAEIPSPLFQTLCTIRHAHPLVIGRPMPSEDEKRKAIFIVFTPFFCQLVKGTDYESVLEYYNWTLKLAPEAGDLGARQLFEKVNQYFVTELGYPHILEIDEIIPPNPPPPPPGHPDIQFVKYDNPPQPVGGFKAIQQKLVYPDEARKKGVTGKVLVYIQIDENGDVVDSRIFQSLEQCDEAAINALSRVKWKPAKYQGSPVKVWIMVPVQFRLK